MDVSVQFLCENNNQNDAVLLLYKSTMNVLIRGLEQFFVEFVPLVVRNVGEDSRQKTRNESIICDHLLIRASPETENKIRNGNITAEITIKTQMFLF